VVFILVLILVLVLVLVFILVVILVLVLVLILVVVVVLVFILVLTLVVVVLVLLVVLVLVVLEFLSFVIRNPGKIRIQGGGYSGNLARGELADVHNNNLSRSTMTTSHMMRLPLEKITSVGIIIMISSLKLRSRSHS